MRLPAIALLTALAVPAQAELGPVAEQRVALEHALTGVVNEALGRIAGGGRAHAVVRVKLEGQLVKQASRKNGKAMSFTMGKVSSERKLKLPGLPDLQQGMGRISQPVKIRIDPKGDDARSTSLLTEIKQIALWLYLDPSLPKQRAEAARQAAVELAGIDTARGDRVTVVKLASAEPPAPTTSSKWVTVAYVSVGAFALALLLGLALVAAGLRGRAARAGAGSTIQLNGNPSPEAEAREIEDEEALEEDTLVPLPEGSRDGRFAFLRGVSGAELAGLLATLEPTDAAILVSLAPLGSELLRDALDALPPERRSALAVALGTNREVPTASLDGLVTRCEAVLEKVRNPEAIAVGGPELLARLLGGASRSAARQVLEALERSDAELARRAREKLVQFEDLPKLAEERRRRLVASLEPAIWARALHEADEAIAAAVRKVLSKRQARMFEEETRAMNHVSAGEVEEAREHVQRVMAAQA